MSVVEISHYRAPVLAITKSQEFYAGIKREKKNIFWPREIKTRSEKSCDQLRLYNACAEGAAVNTRVYIIDEAGEPGDGVVWP